jgi:choline dehydrogenase-like flavoprotein
MSAGNTEQFDVVVVGGGPSGATAAAAAALRGRRTLVLESELFPRYQIGESLLPLCMASAADWRRRRGRECRLRPQAGWYIQVGLEPGAVDLHILGITEGGWSDLVLLSGRANEV